MRGPAPDRPKTCDVTVESLGGRGHGIARIAGAPVFVPEALPGETVTVRHIPGRDSAELQAILVPSPDRVEPPCPHFGTCGGCAIQHASDTTYRTWKRGLVVDALAKRGLAAPVADLVACAPRSRRRVRLAARRLRQGPVLGFQMARSNRIVDVADCPVMLPALQALIPDLRALAGAWLPEGAAADIVLVASGDTLDATWIGGPAPGLAERESWAAFVQAHDLARLSWKPDDRTAPEPICAPGTPVLTVGGGPVALPPAPFLQATAEAEAVLIAEVCQALAPAGAIADLYAGVGTFALPLAAAGHRVRAWEGDGAAVAALSAAGVPVDRRDLVRSPLGVEELAAFDGIVLDPPRIGARAQCEILAGADLGHCAMVSCNPGTLARDLRLLVDGGWTLDRLLPVDQFLWSAHVEAVAVLRR